MDDLGLDEFDPLEHIRSGSNRCSVASDDDCDAPPSPYMGAEHPIKPAAVIAIPTRDSLRATNVQSSSLPTHLPGNNFRHTYLMRVLRSDQPSPSQQSASPGAPLLYRPHIAVIPTNTPLRVNRVRLFFLFCAAPAPTSVSRNKSATELLHKGGSSGEITPSTPQSSYSPPSLLRERSMTSPSSPRFASAPIAIPSRFRNEQSAMKETDEFGAATLAETFVPPHLLAKRGITQSLALPDPRERARVNL